MNTQHTKTKLFFTGSARRNALMVPMVMLCVVGSLLAGCGKKDDSAATPAPAPPPVAAQGATPGAAPPETVKGTPEQETAKQRAIDEGAAIHAANDPAQGGK